jgi:hypothetical protein
MRTSYQRPDDYEPVERIVEPYICPSGDTFTVTFAADSAVQETWECRRHGLVAHRADLPGDRSPLEEGNGRPPKTHLDHVLERRSPKELQQLLDERLGVRTATRSQS